MKKWSILILFLCTNIYAQSIQDSVALYMNLTVGEGGSDSLKLASSAKLLSFLKSMPYKGYDATKAVKYLGHKAGTNVDAELFSWSVPLKEKMAHYNLFKFKTGQSFEILCKGLEDEEEYPCCLFYDILGFSSGKKDYCVLFGWNGRKKSEEKSIYIAAFDEKKGVDFSHALLRLKGGNEAVSYTLEYRKEAGASLRHDKKGKRILIDHASPESSRFEGLPSMYIPDGTFDAFILEKGRWIFEEEVQW
ncbi:hypothetical protein FACS1894199_15280 [Bacteroidia bacterium]|nr:hypothetical protein FACS1894199_15280 [Bacteroidia bacterium]